VSVFTNPASGSVEHARAYTRAVLELVAGVDPLGVLRDSPAAVRRAVAGLSEEQIGRPEAPGKWSMRHVIRHLADSELVWGYRLRMVLAHERPPLTGYDQDAWADRLSYGDADVEQAMADFEVLRRSNLWLLERASAEDLRRVGVHVERGEESVEHMIRLYAGHDVLHLRQLDRIRSAVTSEVRS
jgi:hypothetical protein